MEIINMSNIFLRVFKNNTLIKCFKYSDSSDFRKDLSQYLLTLCLEKGISYQYFVDIPSEDLLEQDITSCNLFIKTIQ